MLSKTLKAILAGGVMAASTMSLAPTVLANAESPVLQVAEVSDQTVVERLTVLLAKYDSFYARFEQSVNRANGSASDVQSGEFYVAKPNRFRWNVLEPFPQEIVSDGEHVWIFDPDLEQVTQKQSDNSQDNAAALILNGQVGELSEQFLIRAVPLVASSSNELFELIPIDESNNFSRIRLLFNNGVLSEFLLEDQLGQRTAVVLSAAEINPVVDASVFEFTVPDGVDLIVDET